MKIRVNPHNVEIIKEQTEPINELEIKVSKCEFDFDEAITGDFVKEAYFTLNGNTYKQIIQNNECDYPSEVLAEKGTLEIGVVSFKVENDEEIIRYNPSPDYFESWVGSLKDAENSEPITPSEMEQFEQELQDGLEEVNSKLDEIDTALEDVNIAIEETNSLDLDVSKEGKVATVTLTKKDDTTKTVTLSDGTSLMFNWDGTKLGIKTDEDSDYTYVDLQGVQGIPGPKGDAFQIKKTYSSVAEMNADFNNMQLGDYVMIASTVEVEDNAKLYTRGESQWIFISDFSGAQGIKGETGATPNIQIGTVASGSTPSVTRTGTNENPVLNFVLEKGETGATGATGATGLTGNGIDRIELTATVGAVKTYTIYYTNGNTTTFDVTDGEITQEVFDESQEEQNEEIDRLKMVYNALPSEEATGESITIDGTAEVPFREIGLKGNTSQEGTPTPEAPQDIQVVSGDNTIKVANGDNTEYEEYPISLGDIELCKIGDYQDSIKKSTGKNLFDKANINVLNAYISKDENKIIPSSNNKTIYMQLKPNTTYTLSFSKLNSNGEAVNFNTNDSTYAFFSSAPQLNSIGTGSVKFNEATNKMVKTFTTDNTNVYFAIKVVNINSADLSNTLATMMIEEGTTATPYEPYGKDWYLNKQIGKVVLDGSENWTKSSNTNVNKYYIPGTFINTILDFNTIDLISDYFTCITQIQSDAHNIGLAKLNSTSVMINFSLSDTDFDTLEKYKTWLSTHNTTVYYVLANPTATEITDSTLVNQLNNLEKANSYDEQTNISQTNNDLPFIITTEAILSLKNILNI